MSQNSVQVAGCIILDQQSRILLLHRSTHKRQQWEIPGGKIEPGESAEQAAIREIKEELGVDVKIIKMLGSKEFTEDGRTWHYTWFEAQIQKGEPKVMEVQTFNELRYFDFAWLKRNTNELSLVTKNFLNEII